MSGSSPMPQLVELRQENSGTFTPARRAHETRAPWTVSDEASNRLRRRRRGSGKQAQHEERLFGEVEEVARMHEHTGVVEQPENERLFGLAVAGTRTTTDQPPSGSSTVSDGCDQRRGSQLLEIAA